MSQLEDYITALCNLYGIVHKNKVLEIYKDQNEDEMDLSDVESLIKNPTVKLKKEYIRTQEDYFVHEAIYETNQFDIMLIKKGSKPYFIPKKKELLKYVEDNYFEKTKEYKLLLQYMKKNFLKKEPEKVEWLCEEVYGSCQFGGGIKGSMGVLNAYDIIFESEKQVNEVVELIISLSNNVRIWENNGHTAKELFRYPKKTSSEYQRDSIKESMQEDKKSMENFENVGRNDRCPCGSGKKFKMCCLKKYS